MTQYTVVVFTNPVAGKEEEFNRWYDATHLNDVLAVPGFVAGRRFRIANPAGESPARYMALYEVETNDLPKTLAELGSRMGTPAMQISPALDAPNVKSYVYESIGDRQLAKRA